MNIKEEILAQVKKGKLDKALEKFEQWAAKNDDELHHSVIMQLSRYNGLKRNEMMGLITSADANLTRNQITYALTSLLEELDDHPALKVRGGGGGNGNGNPAPIAPKIRKLFISYAREDREYVDQLEKHLSSLIRSGHIDSWTDSDIKAGQAWGDTIEDNLRSAEKRRHHPLHGQRGFPQLGIHLRTRAADGGRNPAETGLADRAGDCPPLRLDK